jgi:hypothetical protein
MATNGLELLSREVAAVFTPLRHLNSPGQIRIFIHDLGYEIPGAALLDQLPALVQATEQLISAVEELADAPTDEAKVQALVHLLEAILRASIEVHAVVETIEDAVAAIPDFLNNAELDQLPVRLLDYLIALYLWRYHRRIYGVLLIIGVLDEVDMEADATKFQPAFKMRVTHWDRLPKFVNEPKNLPELVYQWESNFKSELFIQRLYILFNSFLLPGGIYTQSVTVKNALQNTTDGLQELRVPVFQLNALPATRTEFGINITPVEQLAAEKPGFAIMPYLFGAAEFDFDISEKLELIFSVSASLDAGIGIVIRPGGVRFLDNLFTAPLDSFTAGLSLEVRQKAETEEIILFGEPNASRLAIQGPHGEVFVTKAQDIDVGFEIGFEALRLVVKGGDGDGFLAKILGDGGINAEAGFGLRVSRKEGVAFTGSGGLEIKLPTHIELGPLEIQGLLIALKFKNPNFVLEAGANFKLELGPLVATVENVGISATLSFPENGGNLGPVQLDFGFKPPNGVGLSIDAGAVKGGGYLYFDFDKEEYAGALELVIAEFLALKAIGLINTKLPGGKPGFSLLIIITAEFTPGIQLGFGFALTGVGGLLGLNRTMLIDPLVQGVRTGAVSSILFPTNIVANATKILSDLRAIFPPQEGIFLIGPMAKISWGTPSLISLSLGVIIQIPGNVVILGRLRLALPTDDEKAVLVLQLSFVGVLEFDKRRLYFFATLFESRVLFITLEGEMGLLMDFSDNPNFVMSVGGFHPKFTAPPLPFPSPKRLALSIVNEAAAKVRVEMYFAITSNSVQMGCRADAYFGFDSFKVEGFFSFDALLRFSPFYLLVQISAGFSVKVFGVGCFSVHLRASLEGPTPWHIDGSAEISLLFWSFDVDVNVTFGERRAETLPPIAVLPRIRGELEKPESWRATLPASGRLFVSLRDLGDSTALVLHPVGTLEISQRFAPLNLTLDKIGNQKPSDVKRVSVSVQPGALEVKGPMREKFAAAQYRDMTDAQKLSAPAYEPLDSGLRLGPAGQPWATGTVAKRNVRYETIIIDTAFKRFTSGAVKLLDGLFTHFRRGAAVSRAAASLATEKRLQPFANRITVGEDRFVLANQADNSAYAGATTFGSYAEAASRLAQMTREDPNLADTVHIIPHTESRRAA